MNCIKKTMEGWCVAYTRTHHEKKIAGLLAGKGIKTFLPTVKKAQQWWDRKKVVDFPLFPSYVFVYLTNSEQYHEGLKAEGVLYFVKNGDKIAHVSEQTVLNIQLAVSKANDIEVCADTFKPGEPIYIQQGPLSGLSGEVVEWKGNQKVLVRVNLLQRNLLMTLHPENIVKHFYN